MLLNINSAATSADTTRWPSVGLLLADVADGGPALYQHCINVSCFPGFVVSFLLIPLVLSESLYFYTAGTRYWPDAGLMLVRRRRRQTSIKPALFQHWTNIKPALVQHHLIYGIASLCLCVCCHNPPFPGPRQSPTTADRPLPPQQSGGQSEELAVRRCLSVTPGATPTVTFKFDPSGSSSSDAIVCCASVDVCTRACVLCCICDILDL